MRVMSRRGITGEVQEKGGGREVREKEGREGIKDTGVKGEVKGG